MVRGPRGRQEGGGAVSIRVMANVWETSTQRGAELLVLLALADWANDRGECDPSYSQLAAKARIDRRRVRRIVLGLESAGDLEREIGAGYTYAKGATSNRVILRRYVDRSGAGATTPGAPVPPPPGAPVPPTTVNYNDQLQQDIAASTNDAARGADLDILPEPVVEPSPVATNGATTTAEPQGVDRPKVVKRAARPAAGKVAQADIQAMVDTMALARGYPPANYARHVKAAKRLILAGRTPADVEKTVAYIRRECRNMDGQPVTMETVSKYIGLACPPARVQAAGDSPRALPDWVVDGAAA